MDRLSTIFQHAPTAALHRDRTRSIAAILDRSPPTALDDEHPALAYAVAHHFLEGTERAARAADTSRFRWYRSHLNHPPAEWFRRGAHGTTITQTADPTALVSSPIAETPYYLLGPDTTAPRPESIELTTAAADIAAEHDFGPLVSQHAAITVLLAERELEEPLNSWTITRLPGTVFVDHVNEPTILARDLIHEAGHNWLNDALNAGGIRIDDDRTFYSPWKQKPRPTFGFIHSCWAFPLTMLFAASAIPNTPRSARRVLTAYLSQHRNSLAKTTAAHEQALETVTDETLRRTLCDIHEMARQV